MNASYPVILVKSEEGYAVSCPALSGCWSQDASENEALQNIREAIQDYLAAVFSHTNRQGLSAQTPA
jgi:predicted RNase H-like HicB family nuclease